MSEKQNEKGTALVERPLEKAATPAKPKTIRDLIASDAAKKQFAQALPSFLTPERFVRVALTMINKVPKLAECTQESLVSCLLDCASLGIEPDGRRAHLIPFRDNKSGTTKCTLIIDYKGYIELARRSGELALWRAELVCEHDEFEYDKGAVTKHKIDFRNARGEVYAVYSYVRFKDGCEDYEVMTRDEVEGIRKRSRAGQAGPWVTDWTEMAKKTAIRRHSKRLPLSAEFREAIEKDADTLDLERTDYVTRPAGQTATQALAERLTSDPAVPESIGNDAAEQPGAEALSPPPEPAPAALPHSTKPKRAVCPNCAGPLTTGGLSEEYVGCMRCPKCEIIINADGELVAGSQAEPEGAESSEAAPPAQVLPACPNCGNALTQKGCSPDYARCPKCGKFVELTEVTVA